MATIVPPKGIYPKRAIPTFQEIIDPNTKFEGKIGTGLVGEYVSKGLKDLRDIFKRGNGKTGDISPPPSPGGKFAESAYVDPRISRAARNYSSEAVDRLAYGLSVLEALERGHAVYELPTKEMVRRFGNAVGYEDGGRNVFIGENDYRTRIVATEHESRTKHMRNKRGISHEEAEKYVVPVQDGLAEDKRVEAAELLSILFK